MLVHFNLDLRGKQSDMANRVLIRRRSLDMNLLDAHESADPRWRQRRRTLAHLDELGKLSSMFIHILKNGVCRESLFGGR